VFTARYALSPYIKQIRFVFKGLNNALQFHCTQIPGVITESVAHIIPKYILNKTLKSRSCAEPLEPRTPVDRFALGRARAAVHILGDIQVSMRAAHSEHIICRTLTR
jgi:hypothetical protein